MATEDRSNTASGEPAKNLIVITGGARSGKSVFAESLARSASVDHIYYIATMEAIPADSESMERIRRHSDRRPKSWQTLEVPAAADLTIEKLPDQRGFCIFDCLSLYVSNILLEADARQDRADEIEEAVSSSVDSLIAAMRGRPNITFAVVTNEVGWGIVPENDLARLYRDLLGVANQTVARAAEQAWLCCLGLTVRLK